jgi:hypothetical protein
LQVVQGGDHSFNVGGRNAVKQAELYDGIQNLIVDWMRLMVG